MTGVITRSRVHKALEVIELKKDPNEITFKSDSQLLPIWKAVLRHRFLVSLQSQGYVATWEDFTRINKKLQPVHHDYDDSSLTVVSFPPDIVQTTVRLYSGGHKLLVMHIYATNTILVQGKRCIVWVKDEFQRLQAVVHIMAELSSVTTEAVTTAVKDVTLVPPPLTNEDKGSNTAAAAHDVIAVTASSSNIDNTNGNTDTATDVVIVAPSSIGSVDCVNSGYITVDIFTRTNNDSDTAYEDTLDVASTCDSNDSIVKLNTSEATENQTSSETASSDRCTTDTNNSISARATTNSGTTDSTSKNLNAEPDTSTTVSSEDSTTFSSVGAAATTNDDADPGVSSADSASSDDKVSTDTTDSTNTTANNKKTDTASLLHLRDTLDALVTEFRDYKVQVSREFRVIEQQHERKLLDLQELQEANDKETDSLRKRCQSLEDKIKELKRLDKKPDSSTTSLKPNKPQTNNCDVSRQSDGDMQPIPTLINNGRYTQPSGRSTESTVSSDRTVSETGSTPTSPKHEQAHNDLLLEKDYGSHTPTLRLPLSCKTLLIGDSNLKHIDRRRLDRSGQTQIRTFRGVNIAQLTQIICTGAIFPQVGKLLLNVGTNDCGAGDVDIVQEYKKLLEAIVTHFPTARTVVAAIPPQSHNRENDKISKTNSELANMCGKNVCFLSLKSIWKRDQQGKINPVLLADKVHYSARGLALFLREAKAVLYAANTDIDKKEHASYASVTKHNLTTSSSEQGLQQPSQVAPPNKADERQHSDQDQRYQKPAARPSPWQTLHTQERTQQATLRHPSTGHPPTPMWMQHHAMSDEPLRHTQPMPPSPHMPFQSMYNPYYPPFPYPPPMYCAPGYPAPHRQYGAPWATPSSHFTVPWASSPQIA